MTVIKSYNRKNTPNGKLYDVKINEAVLLFTLFTIVYPTSLLLVIVVMVMVAMLAVVVDLRNYDDLTPELAHCGCWWLGGGWGF